MIILQQLEKILGKSNAGKWYDVLVKILPKYEINTNLRIAAFLAETSIETGNYTRLKENLNYSAIGLVDTFPKYFTTIDIAMKYTRNPEKIANKIYGNRMGNNIEGDGFKYIGRGLIQVTGKENYHTLSHSLYGDDRLLTNPDLLVTDKDICVESACWFWKEHKLNEHADKKEIAAISKIINGGTNELQKRISKYNEIIKILS